MQVAKDDSRTVMAYTVPNDTEFVERFKQIKDNEQQILNHLNRYKDGKLLDIFTFTPWPIEKSLNKFKDNILYGQLTEYGTENITFDIDYDLYGYFMDVMFLDNDFIPVNEYFEEFKGYNDYNKYCLLVEDEHNNYYGMIWAFCHPDYPYLAMYGIRSTIIRYLLKNNPDKYKDIANLLIQGVKNLAKSLNKTKIVVPNPLPTMVKILKNNDFVKYDTAEDVAERKFLNPINDTTNYFMLNLN